MVSGVSVHILWPCPLIQNKMVPLCMAEATQFIRNTKQRTRRGSRFRYNLHIQTRGDLLLPDRPILKFVPASPSNW